MTLYVWTPAGSIADPQRRLLIDRYIAAVDSKGVISTGHSALELKPELYISHYPGVEIDHSPDDFTRLLRAGRENDVPGRWNPTHENEAAEWCEADQNVVFRRFDADALRAFWDIYRQDNTYNLTSRSCSTVTALAIESALEGVLGQRRPWLTFFSLLIDPNLWLAAILRRRGATMAWTPGLVLDYARVLKSVVERQDWPWFARLSQTIPWLARRRRQAGAMSDVIAPAGGGVRSSQAAVIATATIFGLTYGLSAPLIALALSRRGLGETLIGLNAAMYALGVLTIAAFLPRLASRFGARAVIVAALLLVAAVLPLFPLVAWVWLWFPLRFAMGLASEGVFVMSEAWINQLSDETSRARSIAIYTAALSLGFALGPLILSVTGSDGALPYFIGGGLALLALVLVLRPGVTAPHFEHSPVAGGMLAVMRLAPVALAATALNASLETAGLSFLPIYAMRLGWSESGSTLLISTLMIGAIALQLPIGWLGDRYDRRRLVLLFAALSVLGALLWPELFDHPWLAYPLVFVWGGVFVGIYTLMITIVGSRYADGQLIGIYAVMSVAWGLGALLGPSLTGGAMELGRHGLPLFAALACALFALYAWRSRSQA